MKQHSHGLVPTVERPDRIRWEARELRLTECYLNSYGGPLWLRITDPKYQPTAGGGR